MNELLATIHDDTLETLTQLYSEKNKIEDLIKEKEQLAKTLKTILKNPKIWEPIIETIEKRSADIGFEQGWEAAHKIAAECEE